MIAECHHCSRCRFEDIEPSNRIPTSAVSPSQPQVEFENSLVTFICVEFGDGADEVNQCADELCGLLKQQGTMPLVICANGHMSLDPAPAVRGRTLIEQVAMCVRKRGHEVHLLSFGYHKAYSIECKGHKGSVAGRRFYGYGERHLAHLINHLGLYPDAGVEKFLPQLLACLSSRGMQVLPNRQITYRRAKAMVEEQLDRSSGRTVALWTCMLLAGERDPDNDYLGVLYNVIDEYDVVVHRAINLSIPSLANTAEYLMRKHPKAIEKGLLLIYNSKVDNIELLLTSDEVLIAFPRS